MKIICDCGQEMEFEVDDSIMMDEDDNQINADFSWKDMEIHAEHDEAWIICGKCEKVIHFFT